MISSQVRRKDLALLEAISEATSDGDARAIEERRAANEASHVTYQLSKIHLKQ